MAPINTRQAAVIDPILSTYARGYRNAEMIGNLLFPKVMVPNRSMRVLKFGKESFRVMNMRRAPGADKKRVQYGYASDPISLVQDALEGTVPLEHLEEAMSVPGIDMGQRAVQRIMDMINLGLEVEIAAMARNAASYSVNNQVTLTTTARWTQTASTPQADVDAAKEAVRRFIGRYPNTMVMGPNTFNGLRRHAAIKDQFKYTGRDSITVDMLAAFFNVQRVIVGAAGYLAETAADTAQTTDIWGDDVILAYVPDGDNFEVPAYGYCYELRGYPQVEAPYFERSNDSWIYPMKFERRPYIVGADAAFLFVNAGQG